MIWRRDGARSFDSHVLYEFRLVRSDEAGGSPRSGRRCSGATATPSSTRARARGGRLARNVEIKARLADLEATRARVAALAPHAHEKLAQLDTFFRVPRGRLKLRKLGPARGEFIFYERRRCGRAEALLLRDPRVRGSRRARRAPRRGARRARRGREGARRLARRAHARPPRPRARARRLPRARGRPRGGRDAGGGSRPRRASCCRALAVPETALVAGAYADLLHGA